MQGNTSRYTDEELLKYIIRDIKKLGKIIPSANFDNKIRLSTQEIKQVSKETEIEAFKIYMRWG